MDVERCDRCREVRDNCGCFCSKCQISFFDGRHPKIDKWQLYLSRTVDDAKICSRCLICASCGDKNTYETHLKWKEISGSGKNLFRARWYCGKELCKAAYKADPYRLEKAAFRKERQSFEGAGRLSFSEACPTFKAMLPLVIFEIDPQEAFLYRDGFLYIFMVTFRKILRFQTELQTVEKFCAKCNRTHVRKILPKEEVEKGNLRLEVVERLTREFAAEIEEKNNKNQESHARMAEHRRKRAAKYPDEQRRREIKSPTLVESISHGNALSRAIEDRQMHFRLDNTRGRLGRREKPKKLEDLTDKQLHANLSLWYLCRAVLDNTSLDGMQPILVTMLKLWWDLGYYPAVCTDYTDIPNLRIKDIIKQFLVPVLEEEVQIRAEGEKGEEDNYNQDITECVVCFESPGFLVRFLPCGHKLVCQSCSPRFTKCVVCMYPISKRILVKSLPPSEPLEKNSNNDHGDSDPHQNDHEGSGEEGSDSL